MTEGMLGELYARLKTWHLSRLFVGKEIQVLGEGNTPAEVQKIIQNFKDDPKNKARYKIVNKTIN